MRRVRLIGVGRGLHPYFSRTLLWVLQAAARTALGAGRNREFHQIRALGAILKAGTRANSETYSKIVVEAEDIITVGGTVVTEHVLRF
jgi:hypothetical protein